MVVNKTLPFSDDINDDPEILNFLDKLTPEENTIMVKSYCHGLMKSKDKQLDLLNHDQINKRVEENTRERTEVLENENKLIKNNLEKLNLSINLLKVEKEQLYGQLSSARENAKKEQKASDQDIIDVLKEDKLNLHKTIQDLQEKLQKNTDAIYTMTNTNNNSQKKGKIGEDLTEKRIVPPCWEYENKAHESHQGDGHLWNPQTQYKIMIDYKNYNVKIPKGETLKLIDDVKRNNMKAGVMVSLTSGISHHTKSMERNSIELEMIGNIPYLFISNANNLSENILKSLMITLDSFISEISGDKDNQVEFKILLLQQSINMLNLSLDKMKSQKKTISTMEKSFRIGINNLRNDIDSSENEIKKIIYNLNNLNSTLDKEEIKQEDLENCDVKSETSDEVQEVIENLITEVSNENESITQELLNKKTCVELRNICKEKGIKGVSKSTKNIIIEKLLLSNN